MVYITPPQAAARNNSVSFSKREQTFTVKTIMCFEEGFLSESFFSRTSFEIKCCFQIEWRKVWTNLLFSTGFLSCPMLCRKTIQLFFFAFCSNRELNTSFTPLSQRTASFKTFCVVANISFCFPYIRKISMKLSWTFVTYYNCLTYYNIYISQSGAVLKKIHFPSVWLWFVHKC